MWQLPNASRDVSFPISPVPIQQMCAYHYHMRLSGVAAVVLLLLLYAVHRWRNPRCSGGRLPPGSMGLPLVGETLQFFSPDASLDVPRFVRHRLERYSTPRFGPWAEARLSWSLMGRAGSCRDF